VEKWNGILQGARFRFMVRSMELNINIDSSWMKTITGEADECCMSAIKKPKRKLNRREQRDLDIEIGFLERLIQRDPKFLEALQLLGNDYSRCGHFDRGLKIDRRLARLRPDDPIILYNLACSCSLNGKVKQAAKALTKAIECGFEDFRLIMQDPDLSNIRRDPAFIPIREALQPSRRSH
jgi:tetratricopeptide (TPR) repeat protein